MGQALQRAVTPALVPVLTSHLQPPDSQEDTQETPRELKEITEITEEGEEEEEGEGEKFPDLSNIPPEIALQVLKNLNATDLCLASCVWQQLASDNILWQGLCR